MSEEKAPAYEGFLDAVDLNYTAEGCAALDLTIAEVLPPGEASDAAGKTVDKPVIYFAEKINGQRKGMILNKTNIKAIKLIHGHRPKGWLDQKIQVTVKFVDAFGQLDCPCLRVLPPKGLPLPFGMRKFIGKDRPRKGGSA